MFMQNGLMKKISICFFIEACNFSEDLVSNDVRITFLGDDVFIIDPNKQGK